MAALRSRCGLRLALAAIVAVRGADAQSNATCATTSAYDTANGVGQCDGLIASGYPCDTTFAFGMAYAGYCDAACGFNLYDGSQGAGSCDGLLQAGTMDCTIDFACAPLHPPALHAPPPRLIPPRSLRLPARNPRATDLSDR